MFETGFGFVLLKVAGLLGEGLGWLLLALAIIAWLARGWARYGTLVLLAGVYLLSIPWGGGQLCRPLEAPYPPPSAAAIAAFHPQAVVVLGGGAIASPLQGPTLPPVALSRVNVAWRLARDLQLPLLASGSAQPGQPSEAQLMIAQAQVWGGIPEGIVEATATTTRGNAAQVGRLLAKRGVERVLLVTSALHLRRALRDFGATRLQSLPVPADPRWQQAGDWLHRLLPTSSNLMDSADAIHEWCGYLAGR